MADYTDLGPLREALRQSLDVQALIPGTETDDVVERLTIVATELATNALRHAQSDAVVRLSRTKTAFVLDVADELPSVAPRPARSPAFAAGGRGLHITQQLALDTGWYVAEDSKHVWAQFRIPRRSRRFHVPRISVFDLTTFVRLLRRIGN